MTAKTKDLEDDQDDVDYDAANEILAPQPAQIRDEIGNLVRLLEQQVTRLERELHLVRRELRDHKQAMP